MIYFIQILPDGPIKIGFTKGRPELRLVALATASPYKMALMGVIEGDEKAEKQLHSRFFAHRMKGEWFRPVPEIFALCGTFLEEPPKDARLGIAAMTKRSILIDDELIFEINQEAELDGVGFSAELRVLVREALDRRAARKAKAA